MLRQRSLALACIFSGLACIVLRMLDIARETAAPVSTSDEGALLTISSTLDWRATRASPPVFCRALTTSRDITEEVPSQMGSTCTTAFSQFRVKRHWFRPGRLSITLAVPCPLCIPDLRNTPSPQTPPTQQPWLCRTWTRGSAVSATRGPGLRYSCSPPGQASRLREKIL